MVGPRRETSERLRRLQPLSERFELLEKLGQGGMGSVYRAVDRTSGRTVALKVVDDPDPGSPQGAVRLERFRREGELTAALSHPGIVRVHDAGTIGDVAWLAYELVEGGSTLAHVLRAADARRRVELVRDAARALGHAHARGVVHRDVKPENILVDLEGRVRVADFGLAAAQGLDRLTRSGVALGTPQYMAPEQVTARRDEVGPATDVWALGVVLFEALAGEPPFTGDTFVELAANIVGGRRERSPPGPAAAAVERALSLRPADRFADGEELAAALDAALAGGPAGRGARARAGAVVAAVASALLVVGVAWSAAADRDVRGAAPPQPAPRPPHGAAPAGPDQLAPLRQLIADGRPLEAIAWLRGPARSRAGDLARADEAARTGTVAAARAGRADVASWLGLLGELRRDGAEGGLASDQEAAEACWAHLAAVASDAVVRRPGPEASQRIVHVARALGSARLRVVEPAPVERAVYGIILAAWGAVEPAAGTEACLAATHQDVAVPAWYLSNLPVPAVELRGPHAEALRLRMTLAKMGALSGDDRPRAAVRRFAADPRFQLLGPRTRACLLAAGAPDQREAQAAWRDRLREARRLDPRSSSVALVLCRHLEAAGEGSEALLLAREGVELLDAAEEGHPGVTGLSPERRAWLLLLARLGARDVLETRRMAARARWPESFADGRVDRELDEELGRARGR